MLKIEFGFGFGIDRDGVAIQPDQKRAGIAQIRNEAVAQFGGCTLTQTTGDWLDAETGTLFSEEGITLSVLTGGSGRPLRAKIVQLAETIKRALNQKAVYVTRCPVQSELY